MILKEIIEYKKKELEERKSKVPLENLLEKIRRLPPVRDFKAALTGNGLSLIAEIKKASPSAGVIREDFDPVSIARIYEENGTSAISVITEEKYFQGSLNYLTRVKENVSLPVLRKDFIFDDYQIYESRAAGADAILLIVAALNYFKLERLEKLAREYGLQVLVEVHNEKELFEVLGLGFEMIGLNNRNLHDFTVNTEITFRLAKMIPSNRVVVSESGISSREDVLKLENSNVNAILVGEALMKSRDIGEKVRELLG
ncbi:MAG: indole-3-glycerol phosphate synthase TrpC, partial [Candidatus Subteraquimicrobiales bacterium]|nr:indole-3-glycerol phosphate synthase TrpC [Candidatus Subteraquimicrobiales bacterium]